MTEVNVSKSAGTRCMAEHEGIQCVLPAFVSFYNGLDMIAPEAVCRAHVVGYLAEMVGA